MHHWEVAIAFVTDRGEHGTHIFIYPIKLYPTADAVQRAALRDFADPVAVRHRRGLRSTPELPPRVLRHLAPLFA